MPLALFFGANTLDLSTYVFLSFVESYSTAGSVPFIPEYTISIGPPSVFSVLSIVFTFGMPLRPICFSTGLAFGEIVL